ncbi:MAG: hypothetical protein HRT89_18520, partial [Lentisphaeria bacterium]|nr:hypothetical protein [Lentisphaeria bacterium]NQZ70052.1 hypothetical protein [Lentisphaeria bacterium]
MYRKLKTSLALILTLLTTGVIAQVTDAKAAAAKILKLTNGARTKIVWQHQVNGGHKVANGATGANYELMAFDTKDGKIRRLLPGPASYAWPLVTRDGKHILY